MIKRPPTKPRTKPKPCWCDGYWFSHRLSGGSCKYGKHGEYKTYSEQDDQHEYESPTYHVPA